MRNINRVFIALLIFAVTPPFPRLYAMHGAQTRTQRIEPGRPLLLRWSQGDEVALSLLLPIVYQELHRLAQSYLRRERADHTLQPTALINEAYLRLVKQDAPEWQSRSHFSAWPRG